MGYGRWTAASLRSEAELRCWKATDRMYALLYGAGLWPTGLSVCLSYLLTSYFLLDALSELVLHLPPILSGIQRRWIDATHSIESHSD